MRVLFWGLIFLLLVPATASAAGFDCSKVVTSVEKTICTDPALSKADDDLSQAYKAALAASLDPETIKSDQIDWLKERNAADTPNAMLVLYQSRIAELQQQTTEDRKARIIPGVDLASVCVAFSKINNVICRVRESGQLGDPARGLVFQVQYFQDGDSQFGSSVIVLKTLPDVPLQYELELRADNDRASLEEPYFADSAGTLLVVQGRANLSRHHYRIDQVFQFADGGFRSVDVDSWQVDLAHRLPEDMVQCASIEPDYKTMIVQLAGSIIRNHDCDSTDAAAIVKLTIKNRKLMIENLKYKPARK